MKDWGNYRKLYESLPPAFERLPYYARCLAAEILRRSDKQGRVVPGTALTDALVSDLAFHVRAHAGEERWLRRAVEELIKDRYLTFADGYLKIRNFTDAQRSDSAARMATKRARDTSSPEPLDGSDASDEQSDCDDGDVTDATNVTLEGGGKGVGGSFGLVSSGLTSSGKKQGTADQVGSKRARDPQIEMHEGWLPDDSQVAALAKRHRATVEQVLAIVPEFVWYWTKGIGGRRKSKATARAWAQTFGNRIKDLANDGSLYADPSSRVRSVAAPGRPLRNGDVLAGQLDRVKQLEAEEAAEVGA